MSYLVTGGTGLLGSRIVRNLVREGEAVVAHDLNPDLALMDYVLTEDERSSVEIVQGDILDYDKLAALCADRRVDSIVHTASMLGNADNALLQVQINTGGMMNVLELARTLNMKKVVVAGSNSVFDKNISGPIPNDAPFHPYSLYGATKAFNEYAATIYFDDFGLDITTVRYGALLFGAGQKRGLSYTLAFEAMYKPAIGLPGRVVDEDHLSWLYVEDAARAATIACKHHRTSTGAFNVGGAIVPIKELVRFVKELIPSADIEVLEGPALFGPGFWDLDMSVTESELGYRPQWVVWDAIRKTINGTRLLAGLPPI